MKIYQIENINIWRFRQFRQNDVSTKWQLPTKSYSDKTTMRQTDKIRKNPLAVLTKWHIDKTDKMPRKVYKICLTYIIVRM